MPLSPKAKHLLAWLIPLVLIFLLFPFAFYATPVSGLDPSWMIAVHLAVKNHLTFGKDFVFTFGPLSLIRFRYPIFVSKWLFLLSDLYFFYILFVAFRAMIKRNFRPGPVIFLFACVLVGQYMEMEKWYFFLMLFFLFSFLEAPAGNSNLIHAGILSLICLYIKVNSGVLDLYIFIGTVAYAMAFRKMTLLRGGIILAAYIVALLISARILHTDLPGYIIGSMQYMKDYEDVMYMPLGGAFGRFAAWGAAVLITLLLVPYILFLIKWVRNRKFLRESDTLFIYLLVAAGLFVWYKNGFVRADGHVYHFFVMVAPLTFLLFLFTPAGLWKKSIGIGCWVILMADIFVIEFIPEGSLPDSFGALVRFRLVPVKIREISNYFREFGQYDEQMAHFKNETARPNVYRDAIGDHTVDIIPSEISTIYFNGLNYDPRPTLQSYAAYNPYLDSLNVAKYMSPGAPEYVLFTLDGMDERFAWTDETRVKLALLQRYRFVQRIGDQLLLKRKEMPRKLTKMREETVKVKLGVEIPVKKTSGAAIHFAKFFIHYDWSGKAQSLVYQPPPLRIVYTMDDGDVQFHKAFIPIYADGMILNKFVDNTREFQLFLLSDGRLNTNVKSIRIEPVKPGGYSPDITMVNTWYTIGDKSPTEQREDSLSLVHLLDGDTLRSALASPPSDSLGPTIRYGIESYRDHGGLIRFQGWAMREKDNDSDYIVKTVARSASGVYPFISETFKVHEYPLDLRKRTDLGNAGVLSIVSRSQLPPGNYELGLALYNVKTGRSLVRYIDLYFDVDKEYRFQRIAAMPAGSRDKDSMQYGIDRIEENVEELNVEGWAVLTGAKAETTTAVLLQNDTATYRIPARRRRRPDIMGLFKKPFLEYSGFSVTVAEKDLPKGIFTVGFELVSADGRSRSWKFSDQKIKLGMAKGSIPVRTGLLPPQGDFLGNVDEAAMVPGGIWVGGWALRDTTRDQGDLIEVVLKSDNGIFTAPVEKISRVDLAGRYNKEVINCGFEVHIAEDALPAGIYRVGLILHQPGKPGIVKFFDKTIQKE
jgi:hypothetical protein